MHNYMCCFQAGINSGNTQAAGFEQVSLTSLDEYTSSGQNQLPTIIGAVVGAVVGSILLLVLVLTTIIM